MIIYLPVKESYFDLKSGEFGSRMITKSIDIEEQWKEFYFRNKRTGYMISNLGRVKRPDGSIAKLYYDKDGYTRFCLYIPKNDPVFKNKKAIRYPYKTHRAVAELFVVNPDPTDHNIVMHLNDIPDCNIYLNLRWGTYQDNMDDKYFSGRSRYLKGEEKPDSKFTVKDVRDVCECIYNKGITSYKDIIHELGYDDMDDIFKLSFRYLVKNIKQKHCWKFIIDEYDH